MPEWPEFHVITGRADHPSPPLILLHGSGGDETSLISLADTIAPQRPYMSLRGAVEWEGGFAFFRRNPDRSLDYSDLERQTDRLCRFIAMAIETKLLAQPPVLVGFSNGAIMAASILQRQFGLAASAILMRPLSPAPEAEFRPMLNLPILITAGEHDQRREPADAELVRQQFANAGADVSALVLPTAHDLHQDEAEIIRDWLIRKGL